MFKILAAALAVVAIPSVAAGSGVESPTRTFDRDGVSYSYRTLQGDGVTRIVGVAHTTGEQFDLIVRNSGRVTGTVGPRPVSFWAPRSYRAHLKARERSLAAATPAD